MNNPKISVIIVYTNENNIYDCIQSCVQQSFSNIEVICVNNGSKDNAENIVKEQSIHIERIKLISIPTGTDEESAKKTGVSIASGEYIIFIENNEVIEPDFIKTIYSETQNEIKSNLKNKYLYRKSFIENDREITALIEDRINANMVKYIGFIDEQKKKIRDEFDIFYKSNVETIKNSTYEILTRFNALEKEFYDRDDKCNENINSYTNEQREFIKAEIDRIYNDIQKVYDYINSQVAITRKETNNIYEEISKNYKYTEEYIENKLNEIVYKSQNKENNINEKFNKIEEDIKVSYSNIKRIMDIRFNEIKESVSVGGG